MRRIGALLAHALGTPNDARVSEKRCGIDPWSKGISDFAPWASLFVPIIVTLIRPVHLPLSQDPGRILVGALTLVARASVEFQRLSGAMAQQLHGFGETFPGTRPASPVAWLTPKVGVRILFYAHAALYAVAASVAFQPK
jgi:hypothetical protein